MLKLTHNTTRLSVLGAMLLFTLHTAGCATTGGGFGDGAARNASSKVQVCKSGDEMVNSSTQCLQDAAACYELSNGKWCTGERGNTCPAGSSQIPEGTACPNGTRCIQFGEGLNCAIEIR